MIQFIKNLFKKYVPAKPECFEIVEGSDDPIQQQLIKLFTATTIPVWVPGYYGFEIRRNEITYYANYNDREMTFIIRNGIVMIYKYCTVS